MSLSNWIKVGCLSLAFGLGALCAFLCISPKTITQIKDRIITKTEIIKPDGTVTTQTQTVEPSYPPAVAPKRDYSVTVTHPTSAFDASRVGVELGRRVFDNVWGVIGWQTDKGAHVGVRVEF